MGSRLSEQPQPPLGSRRLGSGLVLDHIRSRAPLPLQAVRWEHRALLKLF